MTRNVAVVGGGIIGAAVARELAIRGARVTLFEKEQRLAAHQTGRNSGVVHAGLYYEPGSLKADLCRRGSQMLRSYAQDHTIAYEECGKLVVARGEHEHERLRAIHERALQNGVPGIRLLDREQMRSVEPEVEGTLALHSPVTGIVDFVAVTHALAADVVSAGGEVHLGAHVSRLEQDPSGVVVHLKTHGGATEAGVFDQVVTCAGLQADRLSSASGTARAPEVVPFFGDYHLITPAKSDLVQGLIYPVPDPAFPFLGVHLTRRVGGGVMVGPNAFLSFARERYGHGAISVRDLRDTARHPGFWRFARRNLSAAAQELRDGLNHAAFVREACTFVPNLRAEDLVPGPRGIRAQSFDRDGTMVDDFVIRRTGGLVEVRNAPSPAATSCLAIAEYVVDRVVE